MAVVNRVPVYICINYFFVLTVEKAQVRRKIALASVHRLAEHVQAKKIDIRSLITSSAIHRHLFSRFFLREGDGTQATLHKCF